MLELLMLLGSSKAAMFQQRRTSSQHQAQPSKASFPSLRKAGGMFVEVAFMV